MRVEQSAGTTSATGSHHAPETGVDRRRVLLGLGGLAIAGAGTATASPAAATENQAPLHGHDLQMRRPTGGLGKILHEYQDTTAGISPSTFLMNTDASEVVVGCTGLTNQVQIFDAETGSLKKYAYTVTSAQRGVQEATLIPGTGSVLAVSSDGIYVVDPRMQSTYIGSLSQGSTTGYSPQPADDGTVWIGTYGSAGRGTFAQVDLEARTVAMMPPIGADTDYVRVVSVAGRTVWGGTGSQSPKLVAMDMDRPGEYRLYDLPDAAVGNVQWLQAYEDYVIVGYRLTNGHGTTMVLNVATGKMVRLAYPVQAGFVSRRGNLLYYFDARFLKTYDLVADRPEVIMEYTEFRPLAGKLVDVEGSLKMRFVSTWNASGSHRSMSIDVGSKTLERNARLLIWPSAFKVQTIYGSRNGYLYAGGYQGDSISRIHPDTGEVRRSEGSDPINQIESMLDVNDAVLYVGSYPGADFIKYYSPGDTSRLIVRLEDDYQQSRPFGMAIAARMIVVGSVPSQGRQGGGLTVINPSSERVEYFSDNIVGDHSIVGLTSFRDVVYGTSTRRAAYGAPNASGWAQVFAFDVRNKTLLWKTTLRGEGEINSPVRLGVYIYVSVANGIVRLRASDGVATGTYRIYSTRSALGYRTTRIAWHGRSGCLVHGGGGALAAVHIKSGTLFTLAQGGYSYPVVGKDSRLYAIHRGRNIREIRVNVPA